MDAVQDGRRGPARTLAGAVVAVALVLAVVLVVVLAVVLAWRAAAAPAETLTGPAAGPAAPPAASGTASGTASPAACRPPVGTSVPDCPVQPASVGETGIPGVLPDGWALYAEDDQPLPTATAERIQVRSRRFTGPGGGMLLVEVLHGDVGSLEGRAQEYEAVERADVRPDATVLVAESPGGRRYLWQVDDRVVVDVTFRDTGLGPADELAVVRGVRTDP